MRKSRKKTTYGRVTITQAGTMIFCRYMEFNYII